MFPRHFSSVLDGAANAAAKFALHLARPCGDAIARVGPTDYSATADTICNHSGRVCSVAQHSTLFLRRDILVNRVLRQTATLATSGVLQTLLLVAATQFYGYDGRHSHCTLALTTELNVQQWTGGIHNIKGVDTTAPYPAVCGGNKWPDDFYSGLPEPSGSYSYQFVTPGIYNYICEPHCYDTMWGSITGTAFLPTFLEGRSNPTLRHNTSDRDFSARNNDICCE